MTNEIIGYSDRMQFFSAANSPKPDPNQWYLIIYQIDKKYSFATAIYVGNNLWLMPGSEGQSSTVRWFMPLRDANEVAELLEKGHEA